MPRKGGASPKKEADKPAESVDLFQEPAEAPEEQEQAPADAELQQEIDKAIAAPVDLEVETQQVVEAEQKMEIEALFQSIERIGIQHRELAMKNGYRSVGIALGGIVTAARTAARLIGKSTYWVKREPK